MGTIAQGNVSSLRAPKKIYIDQNTYSHMISCPSGRWQDHPIGEILEASQNDGSGQVWLSPINVIETVQASDPQIRIGLANAQLDLADGTRMWHGPEFEVIRDFFSYLRWFHNDAIKSEQFVQIRSDAAKRIWLGSLAMIVARPEQGHLAVASELNLHKLANRLMHARLIADPDTWIAKMEESLASQLRTPVSQGTDLPSTEAEILAEISELESRIPKLAKVTREKLVKYRDRLSSLYGAYETWNALAIMDLPNEASNTFNAAVIVDAWESAKKTGLVMGSLDKTLIELAVDNRTSESATWQTVWNCIREAALYGLVTSKIAYEALLRELETTANNGKIPTGGLVFDMDHACALMFADVFVTRDQQLSASAKTIAADLHRRTKGQTSPKIASTPKQLKEALR